jgi:tRNA G18 (ribose-2'-O)-methylase SpoU
VTGADDPRLALYRGVSDTALLRTHDLFVAEGRLVVRRVLRDPRYRVVSVLVNDAACQGLGDAVPPDVPLIVSDAEGFRRITGHDFHRGCLALVRRPPPLSVEDVLDADEDRNGPATVVVLEDVTDADNVGGVFRNAAAFGARGVILSPGCCDPLYRKAVRTSMAAVLQVPFARADGWPGALESMRDRGFLLVALTPRPRSVALEEFCGRRQLRRIALMVGTEGAGLAPAAESLADERVSIPMSDAVDSLNLSVAVGIALHALRGPAR